MSDKDKLIALLSEFGIGFEVTDEWVQCRAGMNKVEGYGQFFATFDFDEHGKFVTMGVWE